MLKKVNVAAFVFSFLLYFTAQPSLAAPEDKVGSSVRCSICGMFVAKYPAWVTQVTHQSGKVEFFDGAKDMFVYYFHPDQYGGDLKDGITEIWVKDYYSLTSIDAKKAFFVTGSDVYGPMGHEFIPFSSQEAAKAFFKDHKAKSILTFDEITEQKVESMRIGQKMK